MAAGIDLSTATETAAETQATGEQPENTATVEDLQAKLQEATAKSAEVTASLATVTAEAEAFKATAETLQATLDGQAEALAGLTSIVQATIKTMALPFNIEVGALAELTGTELVAKHKEIADLFKSKVKAGGVAAATRETQEEATQQTQSAHANPLFFAAAKLNSRKGK
jgi:hypothetical protein